MVWVAPRREKLVVGRDCGCAHAASSNQQWPHPSQVVGAVATVGAPDVWRAADDDDDSIGGPMSSSAKGRMRCVSIIS